MKLVTCEECGLKYPKREPSQMCPRCTPDDELLAARQRHTREHQIDKFGHELSAEEVFGIIMGDE